MPKPFETLGTYIFEFEDEGKAEMKFVMWRDRATGLTFIDHLKTYTEGSWEPSTISTENVIQCMVRWMMTYPTPRWVVMDCF